MSPRDEGGIHPRHEKDTGRSARTGRGRRAGEGSGPAVPLNERIDALGRAADALETVAPEADVQATREVLDRSEERRVGKDGRGRQRRTKERAEMGAEETGER